MVLHVISDNKFSYHFEEKFLFSKLIKIFLSEFPLDRNITFLCIGVERSAGDCFGPLTGTLMKQMMVPNVIGSLDNPIHAKNLLDVYNTLENDRFIVAIDASLGGTKELGHMVVKKSPIHPGKAMGRELPSVGDISVILNVNIGGIANYLLLQNSSLYMVWKGANTLARSIATALYIMKKEQQKSTAPQPAF